MAEMDDLEGDLFSPSASESRLSLPVRSASTASGNALGVGTVLGGGAHRAAGSSSLLQPRSDLSATSGAGAAATAARDAKGVRPAGQSAAGAQTASSSSALKRPARPPLASTRGPTAATETVRCCVERIFFSRIIDD